MLVKSKYVDLYDISNPIKEYIERIDTVKFHNQVLKETQIFIEQIEFTSDNSFPISFADPKPVKFNKVCDRESHDYSQMIDIDPEFPGLHTQPYHINIALSQKSYQYNRRIFSLLELTGILGGIFEVYEVSLSLLFGLLYSYFSKRSLLKQIMSNNEELQKTKEELEKLKKIISTPSEEVKVVAEPSLCREEEKFVMAKASSKVDLNSSASKLLPALKSSKDGKGDREIIHEGENLESNLAPQDDMNSLVFDNEKD